MTAYRAILQFVEDGSVVTGYWDNPAVARTTYKGWVGLYTHDPAVAVEDGGAQRIIRTDVKTMPLPAGNRC
ncbi:hypothetical protein ACWCQQ_38285 [Streptomyces sp. NPDC002143]